MKSLLRTVKHMLRNPQPTADHSPIAITKGGALCPNIIDASASTGYLTGQLLVATPVIDTGAFAKSVIYMFSHSADGAMGLIINKPTDITLKGLFDKVDLSLRREDLTKEPVFQGGPVQTERGFVLHEPQAAQATAFASTLSVPDGLAMTTS